VILSDALDAMITALILCDAWERAHWLPHIDHGICLIQRVNMVSGLAVPGQRQVLGKERGEIRKGDELAKAVCSSRVCAALDGRGRR
jgi:hypothetical protein